MELFMTLLKAFLVGGVLCAIGQIFIDYTKLTPARILTGYVVAGVVLGGIGLYPKLIEFAARAPLCRCSASEACSPRASKRPSRPTGCSAC